MLLTKTPSYLVKPSCARSPRLRRILRINAEDPNQTQKPTESLTDRLRKNPVATVLDYYVEPDTGYEMTLFPLTRKVKTIEAMDDELTEQRRKALRDLATKELKNIDVPEQTRRKIFGAALLAVVLAVDVYLVIDKAGFWPRFAMTPFFAFGAAYLASGQVGICNIAQKGMWQVDGKGLTTIEDKDVAKRLKKKVNDFNTATLLVLIPLSLAFSLYPLN